MCGRYTLAHPIGRLFDLPEEPDLPPRYNIAPTQDVPVVLAAEAGGRTLRMMRWGLIPSWSKDPSAAARMINARSETAAEKPAFRQALRRRRCLIPADGFYEWQARPEGKQPYHIRRKDGGCFAFAGLWDSWRDGQQGPVQSCTILTTAANELLRPIHDRMPVILPVEAYPLWLDAAVQEPARLSPLLAACPADEMLALPVGRAVNDPRHDSPDCLRPA